MSLLSASKQLNLIIFSTLWLLASCGGGSDGAAAPVKEVNTNFPAGLPVPDNRFVDTYSVLIFGNSHVRSHNLADLIVQMIQTGRPGAKATAELAAGILFLDERFNNQNDLRLLQSKTWTHLILQGQKYSTSGAYYYPTDKTVTWVKDSKAQQVTPILFPEHPTAGNKTEGMRVHQLHQSIQQEESSCLAPVGLAWDKALELYPELALHSSDGNHAALAGAFLTALVLYQSITGNNADTLPQLSNITLSAQSQQQLRQAAAATLQQYPACPF
jgi:hypothetical protein